MCMGRLEGDFEYCSSGPTHLVFLRCSLSLVFIDFLASEPQRFTFLSSALRPPHPDFFLLLLWFFKIGVHNIASDSLELVIQRSACLCSPCSGIRGVCHTSPVHVGFGDPAQVSCLQGNHSTAKPSISPVLVKLFFEFFLT